MDGDESYDTLRKANCTRILGTLELMAVNVLKPLSSLKSITGRLVISSIISRTLESILPDLQLVLGYSRSTSDGDWSSVSIKGTHLTALGVANVSVGCKNSTMPLSGSTQFSENPALNTQNCSKYMHFEVHFSARLSLDLH